MAFFFLLIRYLSAGLKQELQTMHLAPKHLCICFNSSILRLSDWIFSSSSSVGGIVACSTDWINLQWIDAPSNIYTSEFYPEVLKFSRLVTHILWLSCDAQPCSYFRRLNIDPEWLYQDNISLFWWFWWMKPRMRYPLVIGLSSV